MNLLVRLLHEEMQPDVRHQNEDALATKSSSPSF